MNANEIVRALRDECADCSERFRCDDGCKLTIYCANRDAANLIEFTLASLESLSAKLAEIEAEAQNAIAINKALRNQLAESQRREMAAVEDAAALRTRLYGTEAYDEYCSGLKLKYRVFKVEDGTLVDGCFVLRPDKDYAAREALRRYAMKTDNDQLSRDLYSWVGESEQKWRGPQEAGE